ncbi:MAG: hypothetical protein LBS50_07365 [Prevotellaceae bacterium]|jgi:hypothetical protein|nr:hypothetical protein [Prevotellaceae bacterium]
MKNLKFLSLFILVIMISTPIKARAIGSWRTHLAYNSVTKIAVGSTKVYAVSDGALFSVDKTNLSKEPETYSKIQGLSDNNVANIAYSAENGILLVAYENGNLDIIMDNGQIINFNDLLRKNINAAKNVNDILLYGDFAYLALPFGIVQLNLKRLEFGDTYIIGENATMAEVRSLSVFDDNFYAVSADKIYKAPTSGKNLVNYVNWETLDNLPDGENVKAISYNSRLYLLKTDGKVYVLENDFWQEETSLANITNICTNDGALFFVFDTFIKYQLETTAFTINTQAVPKMAIYDRKASKIWFAAATEGLGITNLAGNGTEFFKPNGPAVNVMARMKYINGRIFGVSGGREWEAGKGVTGNVVIFENNKWKNIPVSEIQETFGITNCRDFVDIAVDKEDKTHYFVASWGTGLYEFRDDKPFLRYHTGNSNIGNNTVYDVLFDNNNDRLWFFNNAPYGVKYLNSVVENSVPVMGTIETQQYEAIKNLGWGGSFIEDKDNPNLKYIAWVRSGGVFAFDNKGTLDDVSDDTYLRRNSFIDQDGNIVPTTNYFCMVQDKKGSLWVGVKGVYILSNPHNFFYDNYTIQRPKIPKNDGSGLADYMLSDAEINVISINGDNQKWIGTKTSGAYLVSEDGTQELLHFTSENSPLISNNVRSIAIDKDGEVFFGTDKGIISYQSDSTEPTTPGETPKLKEELHIFPNPVRENYHGPVAIKGLCENSIIKITDISGNLIYETISKGGMVTWDGNRKGGQRVSTGVYLVIITNKSGERNSCNAIKKMLVVN